MSEKKKYKRDDRPKPEREGTISEIRRIVFSEIPNDLIDLSVLIDEKVNHIYSVLRWAKRTNQLFDTDTVVFITVDQLKNTLRKGAYALLDESEYTAYNKEGKAEKMKVGSTIIMEKHNQFGWQPKRTINGGDPFA